MLLYRISFHVSKIWKGVHFSYSEMMCLDKSSQVLYDICNNGATPKELHRYIIFCHFKFFRFLKSCHRLIIIFDYYYESKNLRKLCFQDRGETIVTESELRLAVSESQKEGFRILLQQYHGYVYAIVWSHIGKVGTREDAEECVSDVFADIFFQFEKPEQSQI